MPAWQGLEKNTAAWADAFGAVWVICGPVIYGGTPRDFIGDEGELPVAIPDAFFKIVVKENADESLDVLAFLIPQYGQGNFNSINHPLTPYLTSVDAVEALTGLDFLTSLDDEVEDELERVVPIALWPTVQPRLLAGPAVPRRLDMAGERMAAPPRAAFGPPVEPTAPAAPLSPYAWSSPTPHYQYYRPCYPARVIWVRRCR